MEFVIQLHYIHPKTLSGAPTMASNALIQTRIDPDVKDRATAVLHNLGLTVSDAVRILLTRVAAEGGLPAGLTADPDAHDVWFRAKVQEALADQRPAKPHDQVMREARALIDGKRRA